MPRPRIRRVLWASGGAALLVVVSPAAVIGQGTAPSAATIAPPVESDGATTLVTPFVTPAAAPVSTVEPERERIADPETRRAMNAFTAVLIGLAVLLVAVTVWFWHSTRPVPASLEPLATMSSRRFRRRSPAERAGVLESVHQLKAATDPPPRAADFLREVRGEDG